MWTKNCLLKITQFLILIHWIAIYLFRHIFWFLAYSGGHNLGCYTDEPSDRDLTGYYRYLPNNNSVSHCNDICSARGKVPHLYTLNIDLVLTNIYKSCGYKHS